MQEKTEYEDVILGEIEDLRKRIIEQRKLLEELRGRIDTEMKFDLEKLKVIEKLRKERSNFIPT